MTTTRHTESPEETGDYRCLACGNRERFIGIDVHGYGGKGWTDHDEDCPRNGDQYGDHCAGDVCDCDVELRQRFTVDPSVSDDDRKARTECSSCELPIEYEACEGGADGAEIGIYTRIECAACGACLWDGEIDDDNHGGLTP